MKTFIYATLFILAGLFMGSCGSQKNMTATYTDLNGEWGVVEMNGVQLDPNETRQMLTFDTSQSTVSGNAGCNRVSGKVDYTPSQPSIIRFSQMISTRMACMDMTLENEFLQTIDKVVRFAAVDSSKPIRKIALYGSDNKRLFVLEKR